MPKRIRVAGQEVTPEIAHTPLRALVPGLDDVGASAIPYARLPRRAATAFAAKFERWSDIADQTLASLWAGEGTMDALVAAAKEAVAGYRAAATGARMGPGASVDRLLGALDERDRVMVSARLWTAPPRSQAMVAQRLGVTKAWVHRHQSRALARFAELLAAPIHQEVSVHACPNESPLAVQRFANSIHCQGSAADSGENVLKGRGPTSDVQHCFGPTGSRVAPPHPHIAAETSPVLPGT